MLLGRRALDELKRLTTVLAKPGDLMLASIDHPFTSAEEAKPTWLETEAIAGGAAGGAGPPPGMRTAHGARRPVRLPAPSDGAGRAYATRSVA